MQSRTLVCCPSANRRFFFNMSAIYHIFSSVGVLQLVGATMTVCPVCRAYPAALLFFCVTCMCWYLPVWSCVYIYVVNCIHNQILALDINIFPSVFQFLFVLACDATQASACSASAVTSQHQTMSAVHCICSGCHAFITTSPSDLQHYYCIQVATHGSCVIFPFSFAHLLLVFSFNVHGLFTSKCFFFYDAF